MGTRNESKSVHNNGLPLRRIFFLRRSYFIGWTPKKTSKFNQVIPFLKGSSKMSLGLLGLKVGMTQVYDDQGKSAPVTVLRVGPCPVLQVRDQQRDGYDALQLGF